MTKILSTEIIKATEQCVQCGLCLPYCPTYNFSQHEAESPRGRIALIKALANEQLSVNSNLIDHLDHCLTCRACEVVCPAKVAYGEIIDGGRALLEEQHPKRQARLVRLLLWGITHPKFMLILRFFLFIYVKSGLKKLVIKSNFLQKSSLKKANQLIPRQISLSPIHTFYPAKYQARGQVALFTGCITSLFDQRTLLDTITILTSCGYNVFVPKSQTCCGALHKHSGDSTTAEKLAHINTKAFNQLAIQTIISCATGCGAMLIEHYKKDLNASVMDINQFLDALILPERIRFLALNQTVVLHTPCSQKNVIKDNVSPERLLHNIPELKIVRLKTTSCCGAGGSNLLEFPQQANSLAKSIIEEFKQTGAKIFLTSNIGCSLHLAERLQQFDSSIEVMHPVSLIARQASLGLLG